ncbi:hypothetical protein HK100_007860 [Physocladia obscura]|uniref:Protein kinase domain-containing protein n=1 Tax=Physocladia obscura TaxID=109957 RepID=A0AAD5XIK4_9FUNG|nr:hypothetical protein HK100_007860 [Physocladia obscura]
MKNLAIDDYESHIRSQKLKLYSSSTGNSSGRGASYGVPGYVISEVIYVNQSRAVEVIVQRGYALHNPSIKVICKGSGQMDETANKRIEHEYETLSSIISDKELLPAKTPSHSYIPKPLEIVKDRGIWTLVIEDLGGSSLRAFQDLALSQQNISKASSLEKLASFERLSKTRKLPLEMILNIAFQIVEALKMTITAGVVHKDINPDNIVVVTLPDGQLAVQLIDFNLSSLNSNDVSSNDTNIFQGTVAYMAPEQTGRLQRNADFRSGLTLWEVLVGRPAYHFNDVLEYMHAHIAIDIEAPSKVDSTIPDEISQIVQKLGRKTPEARYQSIHGLKYDVGACLKIISKFKKFNKIDSSKLLTDEEVSKAFKLDGSFVVASKDCSKSLNVPKGKLYGRKTEQELLLSYINNGLNTVEKSTFFILISGEKGMGNNSLLTVARANILETNNFCVTGAYNEGCLPLQGILQAITQFIGILLSSPVEVLESYKSKISLNLSKELERLDTVIPDIRLLFHSVSKKNTEDRIHRATYPNIVDDVVKFIKSVAECEKAFVLCLKDIDSADDDTFSVLTSLKNFKNRFLVILTSSESETRPAKKFIANLQNTLQISDNYFHEIILKPLNVADIKELLEDTISPSLAPLHNLAALIERKTFGTPSHILQFLLKAEAKALLWFDEDDNECGWNWDITSLDKHIEVSESVLKDMTKKINSLLPELKAVLDAAVCIGPIFDVRLLSLLLNEKTAATTNLLWDFLKGGLIKPIPFGESKGSLAQLKLDGLASIPDGAVIEYKFAFDPVYIEIYESLSSDTKENYHLQIARILLSISKANETEICKHYNNAINKVADREEKLLIASINLQAAKNAVSNFEFENGKKLLLQGIHILTQLGETENNSEYFELNMQLVKCMIVDGELDEAVSQLKNMESNAKSKIHLYKVFYFQRHLDAMRGDFKTLLDQGIKNLKDFGVEIPKSESECTSMALSLKAAIDAVVRIETTDQIVANSQVANEEDNLIQAIILSTSFAAFVISDRKIFACLITLVTRNNILLKLNMLHRGATKLYKMDLVDSQVHYGPHFRLLNII